MINTQDIYLSLASKDMPHTDSLGLYAIFPIHRKNTGSKIDWQDNRDLKALSAQLGKK